MPVLRSAFIALSHNRPLRRFFEHSALGTRLNKRFIAGMDSTMRCGWPKPSTARASPLPSIRWAKASPPPLEAHRAADVYHRLLDAVAQRGLDANLSVKLTQMGLGQSPELAESIAGDLVHHARAKGNFVRIDMEDSNLTQTTLDIVRRVHARAGLRGAVGVVIQAYLYRSHADVEQLIADGVRIRLCKGAYNEPAGVAFPRKPDVDTNFLALSKMLVNSPIDHALATHDETLIAAVKAYAAAGAIAPAHFEFQMLYGVRRDLQRQLVRQGYKVRVYVPFGREWYPYFMRRLAERPANVLFLARNFFRS